MVLVHIYGIDKDFEDGTGFGDSFGSSKDMRDVIDSGNSVS